LSYRKEIRDGNRAAMSAGWRLALWVIAIVLLIGAISAGIWAFKVSSSGIKGEGDQTRIVNDGRNRVNSQEWFEEMYQKIISTDKNIDEAAVAFKANPKDEIATENLAGLKNRCNDMVGQYNAEANKVSRGQWRRVDLPYMIDDSDPKTDCKETTK
jgi:hypothetical protein